LLRQHIRQTDRIHGIVTHGGDAPNVVPGHTSGTFLVRSRNLRELADLEPRVRACFEAGALATGCTHTVTPKSPPYSEFTPYDDIGERYRDWSAGDTVRDRYAQLVADDLSPGALIVDLGCGVAGPGRSVFAAHRVVGVDCSHESLAAARRRSPGAAVIQADMASVSFRPASIDAVVAFYSVIHVPREVHAVVFAEIVRWLRPGGLFVASLGVSGKPGGTEDDWLGPPMYLSGFDAETNRALIEAAGIDVERA